jgi:hypothetical protein
MAISDFIKNDVQGTITLIDGSASPVELELDVDRGDLALENLAELLNEEVTIERRGRLLSVNVGARIYPTLSFSAWLAQFTDAAVAGLVTDFVLRQGAYAGNKSTLGLNHPIYAFNVKYSITATADGVATPYNFTVHDFRPIMGVAEGQPGSTVNFSGRVLGEVDGDLNAAEVS